MVKIKIRYWPSWNIFRAVASSIIGGLIFIYSCSRHANSPDLRGRLPHLWLDFISRTILKNYVKLPICLQHFNVIYTILSKSSFFVWIRAYLLAIFVTQGCNIWSFICFLRNKNNNKEVGGQAKKNVSNSFVLPHQHMVAMTSDENALWLPQNAGNLFTAFKILSPSLLTANVGMSGVLHN